MRKVVAGSVALVAAGAAAWFVWEQAPKDDPKLFANRVWTDRARKDDRELLRYLVPIELAGRRKGSMSVASKYRFAGEIFGWSRDGQKLTVTLPQDRRTVVVDLRTWKCGAGEAPEGFDLCLELKAGDRKQRMYSRKGWRVPKGEDLPIPVQDLPDPPDCPDCEVAGLEALWLGAP